METRATPLYVELFGWYGTAAVLGAYLLLGIGKIEADVLYHALNASGAFGIGLISWFKRAWQPVTLNVIWMGIALIALIRTTV